MRRRPVHVLAPSFLALCLVLGLAAVTLWVRSLSRSDWVRHARITERLGFTDVTLWSLEVNRGVAHVRLQRNRLRQGPGPNRLTYGGFKWETHPPVKRLLPTGTFVETPINLGFGWDAAHYAGADGGHLHSWSARFPLWAATAAFAAPPALWIAGRHRRRPRPGRCRRCGYDLTGNESGACPECGRATAPRGRGAAAR